jgi:hypothetical protein
MKPFPTLRSQKAPTRRAQPASAMFRCHGPVRKGPRRRGGYRQAGRDAQEGASHPSGRGADTFDMGSLGGGARIKYRG